MPRALAPLTRRLLGGAGLEERLGLLDAVGEWPAWHEHARRTLELSPDWPRIKALLERIVAGKLPVLIYGDYDVDGTFASFMLFRYLRSQGFGLGDDYSHLVANEPHPVRIGLTGARAT